jgi:hypothetical protein
MIFNVIKVLAGKVKVCCTVGNDSYFIDSVECIDDKKIIFKDAVDKEVIELSRSAIEQSSLTTYGEATVPTMIEIGRIQSNESTFFEDNSEDHAISNKKFDSVVAACKEYIQAFTDKDAQLIKNCEGRTRDLEKLKILGADRVLVFNKISVPDSVYVRQLYWALIEKRLIHSLQEIDASIDDIDDEEFKADAETIKEDLRKNVGDFKYHMKGVEFEKLFNQWPTLLNPSPFDLDGA